MPIYEYRREDGTTFEVMQSFSDDALKKDPETGQKVVRVLHAPAVHFKGSGFYNTDYGTKRRAREMEASSNGSSSESKDGAGDAKSSMGESKDGGSKAAAKDGAAAKKKDATAAKPAASKAKSAAKS